MTHVKRALSGLLISGLLGPLVLSSIARAAVSPARVLITELQTSSILSTNDDFIELTNVTDQSVDISGWKIQTKATSATSQWIDRVTFASGTILYPEGSVIVSHDGYHVDIALLFMSFNMSFEKGHVRLLATDTNAAEDTVGWGIEAFDAEGSPAQSQEHPSSGLWTTQSLSRTTIDADGTFQDTDDNSVDFVLGEPNPRADNAAPVDAEEPGEEPVEPEEAPEEPADEPSETPEAETPDAPIPTGANPEASPDTATPELFDPYITELLPDPASPETDAADEWVELFNPNDKQLSLDGYLLQTGSTFSYNFSLQGITLEPLSYTTFRSVNTNLTLSNSGGAARIVTPEGTFISIVSYTDVEAGWTYALNNSGLWEWTTTPTPDAVNIITKPLPAPLKAAAVKLAKSTVKSTTAKKATTVKAASTAKKKAATNDTRSVFDDPAALPADPPLHPAILVGIGLLAVLYAVYEYKDDARNHFRQLRSYLKARR